MFCLTLCNYQKVAGYQFGFLSQNVMHHTKHSSLHRQITLYDFTHTAVSPTLLQFYSSRLLGKNEHTGSEFDGTVDDEKEQMYSKIAIFKSR
jgi:hypothetical protein